MNESTDVAAVRGLAMARAAEAMLRTLGGREVRLVLPGAGGADTNARQLGMDNPAVETVTLAPVVVRRGERGRYELLLAAATLERESEARQVVAPALLKSAVRIEAGDLKLRPEYVAAACFGGAAYLYRVTATEV
ncbi:MAG: hypothetical protein ACE14L_17425 [Terriglobales bacterium]